MTFPNLQLMLRAAARRLAFRCLALGITYATLAFLLVLLLCLTIDAVYTMSPTGLWIANLLIATILAAIAMFTLIRLLRNRFSADRIARQMECELGLTDNRLINAVQLEAHSSLGASRPLVQQAVAQGEEAAKVIDVKTAIAMRRVGRLLLIVIGVMIFAAGLFMWQPSFYKRGLVRLLYPNGDYPAFTFLRFQVQIDPRPVHFGEEAIVQTSLSGPDLPDMADIILLNGQHQSKYPMIQTGQRQFRWSIAQAAATQQFYIDTPKGRSDTYDLDVLMRPLLKSASVKYGYPPYTKWHDTEHRIPMRPIKAIKGTDVSVRVKSNVPLSGGILRVTYDDHSEKEIELLVDTKHPQKVAGSFRLDESATGTIRLQSRNGSESEQLLSVPIVALTDSPPIVEITDPEPVLAVVEGWNVPLKVHALDDVEITDMRLIVQSDGRTEQFALETRKPTPRVATAEYEFDLRRMELQAGDEIRYFASARDNLPIDGQSGNSEVQTLRVVSTEQYAEMLRNQVRMQSLMKEAQAIGRRLDDLQQVRQEILRQLQDVRKQVAEVEAETATEDPKNEKSASDNTRQSAERLADMLADYGENVSRLAEDLRQRTEQSELYASESQFRSDIEEITRQLRQQDELADRLQQNMDSVAKHNRPPSLDQNSEAFQRQSDPFGDQSQRSMRQASGQAFAQSPAQVGLRGPMPTGTEQLLKRIGRMSDTAQTDNTTAWQPSSRSLPYEQLDVQSPGGLEAGRANLQGVPLRYREEAEAYFRRL